MRARNDNIRKVINEKLSFQVENEHLLLSFHYSFAIFLISVGFVNEMFQSGIKNDRRGEKTGEKFSGNVF